MALPPTSRDDDSLGGRFWRRVVGMIVAVTVGSIAVLYLFGYAWYSWGLVGALLAFGAVAVAAAWVMDRSS
jgi:hypothetical protein